jgi:cyclopropane fatty-acyl-phospholipid synthase-like methyltransferase
MYPIDKPYSEACEENKRPILDVIGPLFQDSRRLLEIGSGTGQHAVFFAAALPHLVWQTSDCAHYLPGIRAWLDDAALPNLPPVRVLDVTGTWPDERFDAVFSANTAHIMSEAQVESMFEGVGRVLVEGGHFVLYGPFNIGGRYTSESNARFDAMLRSRDPAMGIRDLDLLIRMARENAMELIADHPMPVNNRTLVWQRIP